ncbi:MAG: hypothetical protein ACI9BF_000847 [Candidatus Paceibacteria bacterium]|jgi:hypothetical protein
MNQQLFDAVTERHKLGKSRESIINELVAAGYTAAEAAEVFESVLRPAVAPEPIPIPTVPVTQSKVVDNELGADDAMQVTSEQSPLLSTIAPVSFKVTGLIGVGVIGIVLLVTAVFFGKDLLMASAPYGNESELLMGTIKAQSNFNGYGFDLAYEMVFEPREPGTPVLPDSLREDSFDDFSEASGYVSLPSEGYIRFGSSGLVDGRDVENIEFDIDVTANVLMEPFIVNAGVSLRLVDSNLYGKINELPTLYEDFLQDVPMQEWLKLGNGSDLDDVKSFFRISDRLIQNFDTDSFGKLNTLVAQLASVVPFTQVLSALPESKNFGTQMAAGIQALDFQSDKFSDEDMEVAKKAIGIMEKYPPIRFIGEPEKLADNEDVYRYNYQIDYDNLTSYISEMVVVLESVSDESIFLDISGITVPQEEMPTREDVQAFNDLVNMSITVRKDGTLHGLKLDSIVTMSDEGEKSQVRQQFEVTIQNQNDGLDLAIPEELHSKSAKEIFEEIIIGASLPDAGQSGADAFIKQTLNNIRSQAEIAYNQDGFTYESVCTNSDVQGLLNTALETAEMSSIEQDSSSSLTSITCNDSNEAFAVTAPLVSDYGMSWCIDSTGFAGEVFPDALSSGEDYLCSDVGPTVSISETVVGNEPDEFSNEKDSDDEEQIAWDDANIMRNLNDIRAQAELVFQQDGNSYSGLCEDDLVDLLLYGAESSGPYTFSEINSSFNLVTIICNSTDDEYVVIAPLNSDSSLGAWCVDSGEYAGDVLWNTSELLDNRSCAK